MNNKYTFTGKTKVFLGATLHQIKALISFGAVAVRNTYHLDIQPPD